MTSNNEEKFVAFATYHDRHCGPNTATMTFDDNDVLTVFCSACGGSFVLTFRPHQECFREQILQMVDRFSQNVSTPHGKVQ